jgi:hypothetical protein
MKPVGLFLLVLVLLGTGCTESERGMYKTACAAVRNHSAFPEDGKTGPRRKAVIQPVKNAARVEVPYTYVDSEGKTVSDHYVVWMKRIAIRWEVDRCDPAPHYD